MTLDFPIAVHSPQRILCATEFGWGNYTLETRDVGDSPEVTGGIFLGSLCISV